MTKVDTFLKAPKSFFNKAKSVERLGEQLDIVKVVVSRNAPLDALMK